ncbi:TonB-dependent receptor [Paraflavitalea sp. CAU 1676]|uniref:SusC/RagA family TonB-linked outer membrane protein n=1 Tax=Paraflavitalea sp. CAU 1676 TaxID=3032598 RepID=UPI0023D9F921|nr:TonB-dependent receptor [Paraflavitalea sp. CAU 1676]MDF2192320.1 TonB-dependent receptor [Paraflavitalea sp. CAU 1676]
MNKITIGLIIGILVMPVITLAQRTITGIVKDDNGPVANASITERDVRSNGVSAGTDGRFSITLRGKSNMLVVTNVGYVEQEVSVRNTNTVEIVLQASRGSMEDVIVVGFGKKQRITNTGSVSTIKAEEIRLVPTANVQNALTGRLPGFYSQQRSGQPGRDAADYFIRGVSSLNADGNKPLIIVDDIEYTYVQLAQINVNEIESISILKDASTTAVYGIKGANGVLVVTTRRGQNGRPRVNVRSEAGVQVPTIKPKFLNAYQTATLVNEARANDGLPLQFTQQDLELFRNGEDPYGHPDVTWYDAIFKTNSLQANTNVDISGGTSTVKYFTSFGALTQNGSIRDFSKAGGENLNTNYFFRRFNFRTNLDIQATRTLSLRLDVTGRFGMVNTPNTNNIMGELYDFNRITPYAAPIINPNGSYAYAYNTKESLPTLNARLALSGYTRTKQNDLNILLGGTQKLDAITRGLSLTGRVAYASTWDVWRRLLRDLPPSYHYDPVTKLHTIDPRGRYSMPTYAVSAGSDISDKRVNIQAILNYDRVFGDHQVKSMILFNQNSYTFKNNVPENFRGYSLSAGYNFQRKYLLDVNIGYNGSDRFQSDKRYGLFPAVSAGWNLAAEPFFEKALPFIKLFKFRAGYGMVGSDAVYGNRYIFEQVYNNGGGYSFGETHSGANGIREGMLGNSNVTWEIKRSQNYAIDVNMWNDKLSFTLEHFRDLRVDQLVYRGSIPNVLGIGTAPVNIGRVQNRGWELIATYQDKIGDVQFNITPTFSYAKNKVLYKDEASQRYPWLAATGHPINQPFGYKWVGFYESEADINKSAKPITGAVKPGDLKYADLNGDMVIDQNDMTAIGKPNLHTTNVGLTLGVRYKGFGANILFQGAYDYSFSIVGSGIEPFKSQFQPIHLQRWTPDNTINPAFPRLTTDAGSVNSGSNYPSDFWLIDAHYVRLKTVELSYQLPDKWLPLKVNNARFYVSGYNLFTWTNYKKYQQDPEVASGSIGDSYLNQRVLNLGLQIGL